MNRSRKPEQARAQRQATEVEKEKQRVESNKASEDQRKLKMTDLIKRQWQGQSPQLPVGERLSRIRIAMKKHGYIDLWETDFIGDLLRLDEKSRRHV